MGTHAVRTSEKKNLSTIHERSPKPMDGKAAFHFSDNRPEAMVQRKLQEMANAYSEKKYSNLIAAAKMSGSRVDGGVHQLRVQKRILDAARVHFDDGWGVLYGITNNATLRSSVPNSVTGSGSIDLGEYDAPDAEQDTEGRIKSKYCHIGYRDNNEATETVIYHCGPSGPAIWRDAEEPESEEEPEPEAQQPGYVHDANDFPALPSAQ